MTTSRLDFLNPVDADKEDSAKGELFREWANDVFCMETMCKNVLTASIVRALGVPFTQDKNTYFERRLTAFDMLCNLNMCLSIQEYIPDEDSRQNYEEVWFKDLFEVGYSKTDRESSFEEPTQAQISALLLLLEPLRNMWQEILPRDAASLFLESTTPFREQVRVPQWLPDALPSLMTAFTPSGLNIGVLIPLETFGKVVHESSLSEGGEPDPFLEEDPFDSIQLDPSLHSEILQAASSSLESDFEEFEKELRASPDGKTISVNSSLYTGPSVSEMPAHMRPTRKLPKVVEEESQLALQKETDRLQIQLERLRQLLQLPAHQYQSMTTGAEDEDASKSPTELAEEIFARPAAAVALKATLSSSSSPSSMDIIPVQPEPTGEGDIHPEAVTKRAQSKQESLLVEQLVEALEGMLPESASVRQLRRRVPGCYEQAQNLGYKILVDLMRAHSDIFEVQEIPGPSGNCTYAITVVQPRSMQSILKGLERLLHRQEDGVLSFSALQEKYPHALHHAAYFAVTTFEDLVRHGENREMWHMDSQQGNVIAKDKFDQYKTHVSPADRSSNENPQVEVDVVADSKVDVELSKEGTVDSPSSKVGDDCELDSSRSQPTQTNPKPENDAEIEEEDSEDEIHDQNDKDIHSVSFTPVRKSSKKRHGRRKSRAASKAADKSMVRKGGGRGDDGEEEEEEDKEDVEEHVLEKEAGEKVEETIEEQGKKKGDEEEEKEEGEAEIVGRRVESTESQAQSDQPSTPREDLQSQPTNSRGSFSKFSDYFNVTRRPETAEDPGIPNIPMWSTFRLNSVLFPEPTSTPPPPTEAQQQLRETQRALAQLRLELARSLGESERLHARLQAAATFEQHLSGQGLHQLHSYQLHALRDKLSMGLSAVDAELARRRLCQRCQADVATAACIPCMHVALCLRCASARGVCPICQVPTQGNLPLRFPFDERT